MEHHCWGFPLDQGTWMHCIGFPLDCVCPASSSAGKKGFRANGLRNSRNGEEVTNGSEVKTKGATHCWGFPLDRGTWMHCIGFPLDCVCPASSSAGKKGFRANGLRNSRNGEEVTNGSEVKTKGATHCWGFLWIGAPGCIASGFLWTACALRPAVREKKASEQTVFEILEMGRK